MKVLIKHLEYNQIEYLAEIFKELDTDGSGEITVSDL